MSIFNLTRPIDENLLYKRGDKNDIRLGEVVKTSQHDYDSSKVVLIGICQDEGVKRNKGRVGSAIAPIEIRRALYKLSSSEKLKALNIFDLGDILLKENLEECHQIQEELVHQILKHGKKIIVIGGGNDISYPDCKALSRVFPDPLVFNLDSHYDVRSEYVRNSGTPYRMLIDEEIILPESFYEIGIKKYFSSETYFNFLNDKKANILFYDDIRNKPIADLFTDLLPKKNNEAIFWGFDMDSVRASDAPGVSAPSPTGFNADDAIDVALIAGRDERSKIFEISEVNPLYDIDGRTTKLAAVMIWTFLNHLRF